MLLLGLGCCNGIETKYLYMGRGADQELKASTSAWLQILPMLAHGHSANRHNGPKYQSRTPSSGRTMALLVAGRNRPIDSCSPCG